MTNCIGIMVDQGMILASNSCINPGVDHIARFCRMTAFERRAEEAPYLLTARTMFGVAMPVPDAMRDSFEACNRLRLEDADACFNALGREWRAGIDKAFRRLPQPEW